LGPKPGGWTAELELRYRDLARLEALNALSPTEAKELLDIEALRCRLVYPPVYDEIVRNRKQQAALSKLFEAVKELLQTYGPKD